MTTARVLVVDDDVRIAASVRRSLAYEGHEVFVAHDGPGGLEAVRSLGPDVIVLDIMLPGVEEPYGEIDQDWLTAYLTTLN